jgi:hypothetical protein
MLRLSLWKLALFYLFVASILLSLWRSRQDKRILALLMLNGFPVMVFAMLWQGGDMERYLPLYPALFLSLACAWSSEKALRWLKPVALVFVITCAASNLSAMARTKLDQKQEAVVARINQLAPSLKPESMIVTTHLQDELVNFKRSYPFHLLNRQYDLRIYSVVTLGSSSVPQWRQNLAATALSVWSQGGEVWVSNRARSVRPRAEWNWVEGDDRRVSWTEFFAFFSQLEWGKSSGGEDGFVRLLPSANNEQFFRSLVTSEKP